MIFNLFGGRKRTTDAKAVVTGAGSGIGRSFALELARPVCLVRFLQLTVRTHAGEAEDR